ncbi:MAG: peptidoglycan editing factor PgeF [Bacteroidetes bacterium]|nr:peptidoglycan editing factor PgeF [Bacteroidota bacterium]
MQIIKSALLNKYPELIFGLSTKIGLERTAPYFFNMSLTVGDDIETVKQNRDAFFKEIGLNSSQIALQKQIHSDIITVVNEAGLIGESDAMVTTKPGIGLAISTADCTPIFIYDRGNHLIAAVHSGWRGTTKRILEKTLIRLKEEYNSRADDLIVYIGPSISQKNYEVGKEVAQQFDKKYLRYENNKIYLDVASANLDMIYNFGVPTNQVEQSPLCSFEEKNLLHSYRRDGKLSGRSLGIIALKVNS